MRYELYELLFPNGKRYFGITSRSTAIRWRQHKNFARGQRKPYLLYDAINKYSAENVVVKTLVVGLKEYIQQLEIDFIALHKTHQREFGYNLALGGQIAPTSSPAVAAKVSASMMGNKNATGTVCKPETRALIAASKIGNTWNKGVPKSKEHILSFMASARAKRLLDPKYIDAPDWIKDCGFVQAVHVIADAMKGASRKEIVAACKKVGIHKSTIYVQLGTRAEPIIPD